MQRQELLAESQILEDQALAGAENGENRTDQVPEEGNHGRKSYRIADMATLSKSFILQAREVLTRHNPDVVCSDTVVNLS